SYEHGLQKNATVITLRKVEFRLVFHAPYRNFKIIDIPNVSAQGNSYGLGFTKKCDGHKLCTESSFIRFFMHHLGISKFRSFPTYYPMESCTRTILRKKATVINFTQSRVSIDFSSTVSEF
ncbi:hypothetical protein BHM03_00059710, partial [Ensete ventricosum]